MATALLLVDVQNDFLPGGALAVPQGDEILPVINQLMDAAELIFATQDWHPPNHGSFAAAHKGAKPFEQGQLDGLPQTFWPTHCVQEEHGARISEAIELSRVDCVCTKGENPLVDSYSGFFDNGRRQTTQLHEKLQERRVDALLVCGLATEYCVKFTVLDALRLGYRVRVIRDGCRGLEDEAAEQAFSEMQQAGAEIVTSTVVLGA